MIKKKPPSAGKEALLKAGTIAEFNTTAGLELFGAKRLICRNMPHQALPFLTINQELDLINAGQGGQGPDNLVDKQGFLKGAPVKVFTGKIDVSPSVFPPGRPDLQFVMEGGGDAILRRRFPELGQNLGDQLFLAGLYRPLNLLEHRQIGPAGLNVLLVWEVEGHFPPALSAGRPGNGRVFRDGFSPEIPGINEQEEQKGEEQQEGNPE